MKLKNLETNILMRFVIAIDDNKHWKKNLTGVKSKLRELEKSIEDLNQWGALNPNEHHTALTDVKAMEALISDCLEADVNLLEELETEHAEAVFDRYKEGTKL